MNETHPHLTPSEIDRILANARHPDPSSEAANAHLSECEPCRRALRSHAPAVEARLLHLFARTESDAPTTKSENTTGAASEWEQEEWADEEWMRAQGKESDWLQEEWGCVAQEDLSRYVADELSTPDRTRVETHLQECHLCRRDARELRQLHKDAEELVQSLSGSATFAPQLAPPVTVPASPQPESDHAAPAEMPKVDAPPVNEEKTVWQRWRAEWLPNHLLAPNSLFPLGVGAAFTASVLMFGFILPLRQQLNAQVEAQKGVAALRIKEDAAQSARLQAEREQAGQQQAQNRAQASQLQTMKRELAMARELQKQNPLAGATPLPNDASGEQFFSDKQGALLRLQRIDAGISKIYSHPDLAFAEGQSRVGNLASGRGVTLGSGHDPTAAITLLTPVACVVASTTPKFQWRPLNGTVRYQVQIREVNSSVELSASRELDAAEWTRGEPLRRGVLYSWQVIAIKSNGEKTPSDSKTFQVMDAQTAGQINSLAGSPLLRGLLYTNAGAFLEAEQEFRQYQQANPHSPQARSLLKRIQALRQTFQK